MVWVIEWTAVLRANVEAGLAWLRSFFFARLLHSPSVPVLSRLSQVLAPALRAERPHLVAEMLMTAIGMKLMSLRRNACVNVEVLCVMVAV
jgi:predicted cobalt transporter CbtA